MIQVAAGILSSNDRILIAKRKEGKHLGGYWEFPGGKIEGDDTPEETLVREFKEEFDVFIKVHAEFHQNVHHYDQKSIHLRTYWAEHLAGNFILRDHDELKWIHPSELMDYRLAPADIPIAEKLRMQQAIQRSYYHDSIEVFLQKPNKEILGELSSNHTNRSLENLQRNAWEKQIEILKSCLFGLQGHIYFEFAIPRMGKRADNIVILKDTIFVIEFKVGDTQYQKHAGDQVIDYCLDLVNFHSGSHEAKLVPVLIATRAELKLYDKQKALDFSQPVYANPSSLNNVLEDFSAPYGKEIDPDDWESSIYKPTPTIIEAAQALYKGHNVKEISRHDSGAINLSKTANCLSRIIENAKSSSKKTICFVTGVPGAGKTLAGLNIANERMKADEDEHAVFLSGNGPLVEVLREALARDLVQTSKKNGEPVTKNEAKRNTNAFIQNIHHFRDEYLKHSLEPTEKVVVFDEAQRAWNEKQVSAFMNKRKGIEDFDKSEPEFLIEVMNRHSDWCTIICLIGGGQEINTGEAGLEAWIQALKEKFSSWDLHYSEKIISNPNYLKSAELKNWLTSNGVKESELHLAVSVRSFRSEKLSAFVHALLELEMEKSQDLLSRIQDDFPIYVTRNLQVAKDWLNAKRRGTERTGLIASSGARRLKSEGIDVKNEISAPHWFLNPETDVRSSFFLEDVATEFEIQGLEIDFTCLAWGANFYIKDGDWQYQKFKGTKWQNINQQTDKEYLKNSYRVLLTRARQGMILYVPKGDPADQTRLPAFYDETFNYLKSVGLKEIANSSDVSV